MSATATVWSVWEVRWCYEALHACSPCASGRGPAGRRSTSGAPVPGPGDPLCGSPASHRLTPFDQAQVPLGEHLVILDRDDEILFEIRVPAADLHLLVFD
jgi:hypothetical protein